MNEQDFSYKRQTKFHGRGRGSGKGNIMKNTLVVNLMAGPGAGKSTLAAGVFEGLKLSGVDSELVTEFAKYATWQKNFTALSDQFYMTAKQHHREFVVLGQVDVMVTDSPLILGILYYNDPNKKKERAYFDYITETFNERDNLTYFVERVKEYNPNGRNQTEDEARALDTQIKNTLLERNIPFKTIQGNPCGKAEILSDILKHLKA